MGDFMELKSIKHEREVKYLLTADSRSQSRDRSTCHQLASL